MALQYEDGKFCGAAVHRWPERFVALQYVDGQKVVIALVFLCVADGQEHLWHCSMQMARKMCGAAVCRWPESCLRHCILGQMDETLLREETKDADQRELARARSRTPVSWTVPR